MQIVWNWQSSRQAKWLSKKESLNKAIKLFIWKLIQFVQLESWTKFLKKHKYRIKTIRLRKELSQELIIPFNVLGEKNSLKN
jgi:hypothetical protein